MILNASFGQPTLWQRVRPWFSGFDFVLIFAILLLVTIGLTAMYSAGHDNGARFGLQVRNMLLLSRSTMARAASRSRAAEAGSVSIVCT